MIRPKSVKKFSKFACEIFHDKAQFPALTPDGFPVKELCRQNNFL